jgi:hypothetical protein
VLVADAQSVALWPGELIDCLARNPTQRATRIGGAWAHQPLATDRHSGSIVTFQRAHERTHGGAWRSRAFSMGERQHAERLAEV